jgi:hypothetical protein
MGTHSPSHLAVQNGHERIAELPLDRRADVKAASNEGVQAG